MYLLLAQDTPRGFSQFVGTSLTVSGCTCGVLFFDVSSISAKCTSSLHGYIIRTWFFECSRDGSFLPFAHFILYVYRLFHYQGRKILCTSVMIHLLSLLSVHHLFTGRFALIVRVYNSSAGLGISASIGVVLKQSSASSVSDFSALHFFRIAFTVCTKRSARPFDWGKCGEDVTCLNPHWLANILNSPLLYCHPLSLTTISGILCSQKIFRIVMTVLLVHCP